MARDIRCVKLSEGNVLIGVWKGLDKETGLYLLENALTLGMYNKQPLSKTLSDGPGVCEVFKLVNGDVNIFPNSGICTMPVNVKIWDAIVEK